VFFERERERRKSGWPSRSKSLPFLQPDDDLSSFNGVATTPSLLFCLIIVIGFSSSYPFGLQIVGD